MPWPGPGGLNGLPLPSMLQEEHGYTFTLDTVRSVEMFSILRNNFRVQLGTTQHFWDVLFVFSRDLLDLMADATALDLATTPLVDCKQNIVHMNHPHYQPALTNQLSRQINKNG